MRRKLSLHGGYHRESIVGCWAATREGIEEISVGEDPHYTKCFLMPSAPHYLFVGVGLYPLGGLAIHFPQHGSVQYV